MQNIRCQLLFLALVLVQLGMIGIYSVWLAEEDERIIIENRDYPHYDYAEPQFDNLTLPLVPAGSRVYHVSREFGVSSMGGLGQIVTALASAQIRDPLSDFEQVAVVVPLYSFVFSSEQDKLVHCATLSIDIRLPPVAPFRWTQPPRGYLMDVPWTTVSFNVYKSMHFDVVVYLIGPGDIFPFTLAFRADSKLGIYNSVPGLDHEWQLLYYLKATTAFLMHESMGKRDHFGNDFVSQPMTKLRPMFVHLHGASNAFVVHFLDQYRQLHRYSRGQYRAVTIYTLHDYSYEFEFYHHLSTIQMFTDALDVETYRVQGVAASPTFFLSSVSRSFTPDMDDPSLCARYCLGHRLYFSGLGINESDFVTFVSHTTGQELIGGELAFPLRELALDFLRGRAKRQQYAGITNGVDFDHLSPFTDQTLARVGLQFPYPSQRGRASVPTLVGQKRAIKSHLFEKYGYFQRSGVDEASRAAALRPMALYVGRFQRQKGILFCKEAAAVFHKLGVRFVIMGHENNVPTSFVLALQEEYPDTVTVIHEMIVQEHVGVLFRAAADFLFVPSLTESFGLVAAEGLLFGSALISSGVGGLKEFLIDRRAPLNGLFNAYLFDALGSPEGVHQTLHAALTDAVSDRSKWSVDELEAFTWSLVTYALQLGWEPFLDPRAQPPSPADAQPLSQPIPRRRDGRPFPVQQYSSIYRKAWESSHRVNGIKSTSWNRLHPA